MRKQKAGVVIIVSVNHMRALFQAIERFDKMRFGKALLGFDVDDVEKDILITWCSEFGPRVSGVIVFKKICLCDLGKECAAPEGEVFGLF